MQTIPKQEKASLGVHIKRELKKNAGLYVLALMLNYLPSARYRRTIQMVSYAPHFISTVVMVGILLQFLDKNSGIINLLIEVCGGEAVNFMAKREYFYHIYQWSGVWQGVGYASVIYIRCPTSI